jgi:hypothetical protein
VKILLDECVPWPLAKHLIGHECLSVQRCGWDGIKNGELLRLAEPLFDLFITSDQSLAYQQNLTGRRIAILLLSTNKLRPIIASADLISSVVSSIRADECRRLEIPQRSGITDFSGFMGLILPAPPPHPSPHSR